MNGSQNFGVLRVVHIYSSHTHTDTATKRQAKYPIGWLPEERLVHLLTRRETTIGRALSCDLVLLDPAVSREHARLVLNEQGWYVYNMTAQNAVRVNGHAVPSGDCLPIHPQDLVTLGNTVLQLVAPQPGNAEVLSEAHNDALPPHVAASREAAIISESGPEGQYKKQAMEDGAALPSVADTDDTMLVNMTVPAPDNAASLEEEWSSGAENLLGAGVTMQFALSRRFGVRMRWFIVGGSVMIVSVSAIIAIILHSIVRISVLAQDGPLSVLAAITIPIIPALGIGILVNFIDRFEREPWFLRGAAFLWGAVIAVPAALRIEQYLDGLITGSTNAVTLAILQGLRTGISEEALKGLGLLLLFFVLRDEFDNVTDGIVYGALIGAGFAMIENFFYFAENPHLLLFLFVGRIVLGWLCHSTFTVCFGMALGYIRHTRVRWRHIIVPLLGFLAAVGLHTVFDFVNTFANELVSSSPNNATVVSFSLAAVVGNYIPPFLAQMVILYFLIKSLAHEVALIREFLASEVSSGVVTVDEYALLQHSFARTRDERRVFRSCGWKQWLRVKALYQTEIGLAFRKWHVSMGDKPKLGYVQPEDAYRRRIKRLRQEIMAVEGEKK